MISYRESNTNDLEKVWDADIAANPGDERYVTWKERFIRENKNGAIKTFLVFDEKTAIGQGTLVLRPESEEVNGNLLLCDGAYTANIAALRIEKEYEGKGYISNLMKYITNWAKDYSIEYLTIGVEPKEIRNMQIYHHWGFTEYVTYTIEKYPPKYEGNDGETVLAVFYRKQI